MDQNACSFPSYGGVRGGLAVAGQGGSPSLGLNTLLKGNSGNQTKYLVLQIARYCKEEGKAKFPVREIVPLPEWMV
jgi:hypothetical protein